MATRNHELIKVQWGDYSDTVSLLTGNLIEQVTMLKSDIKGIIIVPGSARLVQSLINAGCVDEINMIIHPVVLGNGKRYLDSITSRNDLKLVGTQLYKKSGSMRVRYDMLK